MTRMNYASHGPEETQRIAHDEALKLVEKEKGAPVVVALEGELGAGKTTFVQAFAKALGAKEKLKSPTFVLMKDYQLSAGHDYKKLYHLDCYRLKNESDLEPLNIKDIIAQPGNIVLIEWAERVKGILPRNHWLIRFEHVSEQERNISIIKK